MSDAGFRTEREALAIIAQRLRSLEHKPDYLDRDAVGQLLHHSGGSGGRLRTGLASMLFLASTEDAPQVDAALAARALGGMPPAAGPASRRWGWRLGTALGAACIGAAGLAAVLLRSPEAPVTLASAPLVALAAGLSAPAPVVVPPTDALSPLPKAVVVREMPVPPGFGDLPVAPPASVLLLFPAHSARALERLRPLALQLQQAGLGDIRARPATTPVSRRVINFFYADDFKLAQLIADTVAQAHWPNTDGNSLRPSLVQSPPGMPVHAPGEVEVRLP